MTTEKRSTIIQTFSMIANLKALKARPILAWGKAPGLCRQAIMRAESPIYIVISKSLALTLSFSVMVLLGCAKPDKVNTIHTQTAGLFFTEETYKGHGAIDNDFTRIYAHHEQNGKSEKMLVLSGTYVALNQIIWSSPREATVCIQPGGFTDEFRNVITFTSEEKGEPIHFLLKEDC